MHNPESVLENEMHELFWDFEIQRDHLILVRPPDQGIVNNNNKKKKKKKKDGTCRIVDFAVPADHSVKLKEGEKRGKYRDLTRELKSMEHEGDGDTTGSWCLRYSYQRID